ncbi:hypothetical protein [Streptomyces chartreusis]|uniref:hypothetical protein n=1 Tax=Streptomyces chartreusis TaxID=1969 RepID=UPI003803F5B3
MNVNDIVAEKIAAARRRAEETKRRRAALTAARQRGLAHRHAAKLRRQADRGDTPTTDEPTVAQQATTDDLRGAEDHAGVGQPPTAVTETVTDDDIVVEVTEAEWHAAASRSLARLGLTYAELEDQARRRDFVSAQAQVLWVSIGGTINTQLLEDQ